MLRRCMTPNPHSKALSDIVDGFPLKKTDASRINYDSFIYVDRLTNKKVVISDMKQHFQTDTGKENNEEDKEKKRTLNTPRQHKKAGKGKDLNQNRQIDEINDCFMLMKTTKLFQMSNLKDKLFSKGTETQGKENNDLDRMRKKKKQIREFIEDYVKNISIEEFRRYMEPELGDKVKLINPNILNLGKYLSNVISKHNIEKIIEEFLLSENKEKAPKKPICISIDDISFPEEERLKELLFHHVFIKNKDFEHLIFPNQTKQIFSSIHRQANLKNSFNCNFKYACDLSSHHFNQFQEPSESTGRPTCGQAQRQPFESKLELKKKEMLLAIQNGSTYDFLFLIIRYPKLLAYKDRKGNNLLHLAAKGNQLEIYNLLLKRLGISSLREGNSFGRTPVDLAKLFGSFDIVDRNRQLDLY